jgi:hypothetical protein
MARGVSFFRNPVKWLRKELAPPPRKREPPPLPPLPPPLPPGPPGPPGPGGPADFYRRIWDQEVSRRITNEIANRSGYSRAEQLQLHIEILLSTHIVDLSGSDQRDAWRDYIASFVTNRRTHADWFDQWGLSPRDFDWPAWRHAMGYELHRR